MSQDFWTPSISSPSIGRINVKELEVQALPDSSFEVEVTQHFDAEVILDTEAGNQIRVLMTGTLSAIMDRSDPTPWAPENCRMPVKTSPSIPPIRFLKIPENLVDAETGEPIKPLPLSKKIKAELAQQMDWRETIIEAMPKITTSTIEDVLDAAADQEGEPLPELTDELAGEPEPAQTPNEIEQDLPEANTETLEAPEAQNAEDEGDDEDLERIIETIPEITADSSEYALDAAADQEGEPLPELTDELAGEPEEDEMKLADTDTEGTTESYIDDDDDDDDDDDLLRFDDDDEEETERQGPSLTSFAEPDAEPKPEPVAPHEPESEEYRTIVLNNDHGADIGIRAGIHCGKVVRETDEGVETVYDLYKSRAGRLLVHENEAWIHEIPTDNLSELFDLLGYELDAKEAYKRAGVNCIRWID